MPATCQSLSVSKCCCVLMTALLVACRFHPQDSAASIVFSHIPQPAVGGAGAMDTISGRVNNPQAGSRLVVYVYARNTWFVQPMTLHPFTKIGADGAWSSLTHLGGQYAVILANSEFRPPNTMRALPQPGGSVLSVKAVPGDPSSVKPERFVRFSGYTWTVRQLGGDTYGSPHEYAESNVTVDAQGYLHLSVTKRASDSACAEVALPRNLGYGKYNLWVEGADKLEPATVFDMYTWDEAGTDQNRREMDTELARWGDPAAKNGEYSVQPFYRPTNTYRYIAPSKSLLLTMLWETGRVKFDTAASDTNGHAGASMAEHNFTTDVPIPGTESIHLNLCSFDYGKMRQAAEGQIVVKRFRYLP